MESDFFSTFSTSFTIGCTLGAAGARGGALAFRLGGGAASACRADSTAAIRASAPGRSVVFTRLALGMAMALAAGCTVRRSSI